MGRVDSSGHGTAQVPPLRQHTSGKETKGRAALLEELPAGQESAAGGGALWAGVLRERKAGAGLGAARVPRAPEPSAVWQGCTSPRPPPSAGAPVIYRASAHRGK